MLRQKAVIHYRSLLQSRSQMTPQRDKSFVVFSPHPDDETLGCGGTIAKKCTAGEIPYVVVMTDGGASHSHIMPQPELINTRKVELMKAMKNLGVPSENVICFGFPDGSLIDHQSEAIERAKDIISKVGPYEVYTTFKLENHIDHIVTNRIVNCAAKSMSPAPTVYEYPIWFMDQWPFVALKSRYRREIPVKAAEALLGNAQLFIHMRYCMDISKHLEQKKRALSAYKSQLTRLIDDERWLTLPDISNGDFLDCFVQPFEVFHSSSSEA